MAWDMHRILYDIMKDHVLPADLCPSQDGLGLAAGHGFFLQRSGSLEWDMRSISDQGLQYPGQS